MSQDMTNIELCVFCCAVLPEKTGARFSLSVSCSMQTSMEVHHRAAVLLHVSHSEYVL